MSKRRKFSEEFKREADTLAAIDRLDLESQIPLAKS